MIWFKSCPRCQTGDMIQERDAYGGYVQCLQCGYMKDAEADVQVSAAVGERYQAPVGSASSPHRRN